MGLTSELTAMREHLERQAPCLISILSSDNGSLRDAATFFVPLFRERVAEFRRGELHE